MKILLVHGWAFAPWMWQGLIERLQDLMGDSDIQFSAIDLGFLGQPSLPMKGHFDLAIGHSFGLLWLLESNLVTFQRLISVNGFTRFSADSDFQCGWPHRVIQRMRKQLAVESETVIAGFMEKSAATEHFTMHRADSALDLERLDWALEALLKGDGREQWSKFPGPRRAIAATKDEIVTVEHTNQCFADSDIQWLKSDSHCLPLKFPEICAALVRELIEVS